MIKGLIVLFLSIVLTYSLCFFVEVLHWRSLVKDFNKRHPDDLRYFDLRTSYFIYKQYNDWLIYTFAKCSDGHSVYEHNLCHFDYLECDSNEKK